MTRIYFFFAGALVTLVLLALLFFTRYQRMKHFSNEAFSKREIMLTWQRINSSLKSSLLIYPGKQDSSSHPLLLFHHSEFEKAGAEIARIDSLITDPHLHKRVDTLKEHFSSLTQWIKNRQLRDREWLSGDSSQLAQVMFLHELLNRGFNSSTRLMNEKQEQMYEHMMQTDVSAFALIAFAAVLIAVPSYWLLKESREKSKLNESLASQNAFVQLVLNGCGGPIAVFDERLNFRYLNKDAEIEFQLNDDRAIGKSWLELMPKAKGSEEYEAVVSTLSGRDVRAKKITTIAGKPAELSTVLLPQNMVLLLLRDISALENLNARLSTINETYDYAEQTSMIGSFRFDFKHKTFEYSNNMFRILGCEINELEPSAEKFFTFVHPEDLAELRSETESFFKTGVIRDLEYRIIRKDRRVIYVRNTAILTEIDGSPILIGTLQDITAEKQIADKLKERTEFAEAILNASVDSIVVIDRQLKILSANKKANPYPDRDITGEDVLAVFPLIQQSGAYDDVLRALKGEFVHNNEYYSLIRKRYYENFFIPLRNQENVVYAVVVVAHDITDIIEAKKRVDQYNAQLAEKNSELKQMNDELASFAYVASHDLQEPLRKIQTFISKLDAENQKELWSASARDYLRRINHAAARMRNLINDLLTYSRVSRGDAERVDTDLNALFTQVISMTKEESDPAQIEYDVLPTARVIPFQVEQLFSNLLSNALKFRKKDEPVVISLKVQKVLGKPGIDRHKEYYMFQLRDNGIGFDDRYNQQIFQLFQRLHGVSEYPGTGLGLAICKKIVENHEGTIHATGKEEVGAVFTFTLPVID